MASGKSLSWSPQGWLLSSPEDKSGAPQRHLSFAEVSYAVLQAVEQAGTVIDRNVSDAVEKNKLEDQRKLLRSAAAQYVAAGQKFNVDPSPSNDQALKDADKVMGHAHSTLLKMMDKHTKGEFAVDAGKQRGYLLDEHEKALKEVRVWKGQIEMMEIDASSFLAAAQRYARAATSVAKTLAKGGEASRLEQDVAGWLQKAQGFHDYFMPPESAKWKRVKIFEVEDGVLQSLEVLADQVKRAA